MRLTSTDMIGLLTQMGYDEKSANDIAYHIILQNGENVSFNAFLFGMLSFLSKRVMELEREKERREILDKARQL